MPAELVKKLRRFIGSGRFSRGKPELLSRCQSSQTWGRRARSQPLPAACDNGNSSPETELNMEQTRIQIAEIGGPEVLRPVREPVGQPGPGEVRVQVQAAGVAFADIAMRYGAYPGAPPVPFVPGYDLVGVVDAVGEGVPDLAPGMRVGAMTVTGAYSEYVIIPASDAVPFPAGAGDVDAAEAVAVVLNYVTAYQMLARVAKLRPGQSILIHGAAGGVGTALLQLGRLEGLTMFGTASRGKHDVVARYGGTPIDYRSENVLRRVMELAHDEGVDAVFDPVGVRSWIQSYRALRSNGTLVAYGVLDSPSSKTRAMLSYGLAMGMRALPGRSVRMYAITRFREQNPEWFRDDLAGLIGLLAERKIEPLIAERLPLSEARRAHELLESRAVAGKLVLIPGQAG
jgi:NADPH:quinone reductase-like Zn-dependent oxidoreductase